MSIAHKQIPKFVSEKFISQKLKKLLRNPNVKEKGAKAIELLQSYKNKRNVTFDLTSVANLVFLAENNTLYTEQYKDFLKEHNLCVSYFEIPRLLQNEQYEQAVLLAIEEFDRLSQNEYLLRDKLALSLRLYNILEEASSRNDTPIVLTLMETLNKVGLLHTKNTSGIFATAMNKQNDEVLLSLFDFVLENEFTDSLYEKYILMLVKHNEVGKATQLLGKLESDELKNRVCLEILSSLEFDECIKSIILLLESGKLSMIDYHNLPTSFLSLPNLIDFESIREKLETLKKCDSDEMKQLIIYSLLSSIDNTNVHLTNTIFLLNGLQLHRYLLNEPHKDIIFHQISKYPMKLTSIKLYKYFRFLDLNITKQNYVHILRTQCHGVEYDTFYYFLIEMLLEYGELTPQVKEYIYMLQEHTKDQRLKLFLEDNLDITKIKESINYEFISKNLEYQRERTKVAYPIINGFTKYDYEKDIKLADSFKF